MCECVLHVMCYKHEKERINTNLSTIDVCAFDVCLKCISELQICLHFLCNCGGEWKSISPVRLRMTD